MMCLSVSIFLHAEEKEATVRPQIKKIVHQLRKDKQVHLGHPVGYSGKRETNNKYYRKYLLLRKKASNQELLLLTKDESKVIVVYAFTILYERKYAHLKDIFFEHQEDTTWYWTAGGCTGILNRVNWYMLRLLHPGRNSGNGLTSEEYNLYCNRYKKRDELFACN